jgi:hypothetical protein
MKRYQVRTKEFEKRNWKVVETFDWIKDAKSYAMKAEYAQRRNPDRMYDSWEVKDTVTGERFTIA